MVRENISTTRTVDEGFYVARNFYLASKNKKTTSSILLLFLEPQYKMKHIGPDNKVKSNAKRAMNGAGSRLRVLRRERNDWVLDDRISYSTDPWLSLLVKCSDPHPADSHESPPDMQMEGGGGNTKKIKIKIERHQTKYT